MVIHRRPELDTPSDCPYLPGRVRRFRTFLAESLTAAEISHLLGKGWRKFGPYFFRPSCPGCRACIPIRIPVASFRPTGSRRRTLRRNADLTVRFRPLRFDRRIMEIYADHSRVRFGREVDLQDLAQSFYMPSCPSLQSEYYLNGRLVAVGFLDRGDDCLSSIYFVYDTAYSSRGLGTLSVLREIDYTRARNLTYYYLGYYIADCPAMAYKGRFGPHELLDWGSGRWEAAAGGDTPRSEPKENS